MVEPTVIEIGGRHVRRNADKTVRLFGCGQKLGSTLVREAVHPDFSVARWMIAHPRDRLRLITSFISERIELSFRTAPPAHVLKGEVIAMPSKPFRMGIDHG